MLQPLPLPVSSIDILRELEGLQVHHPHLDLAGDGRALQQAGAGVWWPRSDVHVEIALVLVQTQPHNVPMQVYHVVRLT